MPASVQMTPSISGTSLAQPTLWTLSDNAGGHTTLAALATFNYPVFVDGNSVIYTITWAGLDNHSLGNSFYVTFNFTASL